MFEPRKSRHVLLIVAALFVAVTMSINLARAGNILVNPGFEADGNHGSGVAIGGWTGEPSGPWYINADALAHSGNNYYKVWGHFNGNPNTTVVYQDKPTLPTSSFQADGWMFTLSTDTVWSGDDADYAWIEVSFRDAGDNILALYKSDLFSDTLGKYPYTTNIWYDMPVTNVCQITPPYAVIGTTNVLVAPVGTTKVRIQHSLYQLLYGGGSVYFDDVNLNQTGGPVPPQITQVYPGNMLFASNHISFHVTSASSSPINNTNIHLVVNGTDVSSGCTFSGSTPDITVTYNGLAAGQWSYTAAISVTDGYGFGASTSMSFDTITPGFVWECEDYDFTNTVSGGGGAFYDSPTLSSTPQINSYYGVIGVSNVDFSGNGNNPSAPNLYRTSDHSGIGFASETARQKFLTAQLTDPGVQDYTIGYIRTGDWMNYTRHYPAGTYNIYARLAGGAGATTVALSNVVSGTLVGNFQFSGNDWGAYHYIPLVDGDGNLLPFTFDGSQQTLSATLLSGGDNMNFFMLVPAQIGLPTLSNISPTNGTVMSSGNTFSFTATAPSGSTINNSGIHLSLNGADVSSGLVISGSGTINVSYPGLASNTLYTAVIAVTNTIGSGVTRTVTFDTMSTANFYVKIEDYDYSTDGTTGGLWDTANNGLAPNGYIGLGAVSNVDYSHASGGGSYPYRPPGMATEVTSDVPLPGYSTGFDYDVGNFGNNDWVNFTRNYPAGKYYVYGRLAGYGMNTKLSQVTSGVGTTTQTLKLLGSWIANPGGWQTWVWTPLQNNGAPVVVTLGGVSTLRVTSAGNCNANYFMLVPVQGINLTVTKSGNNAVVSFPTKAGSSYSVYSSTSLTGSWVLVNTVAGNGSVKSVNDSIAGGARFYKVTSP